MKLFIKEIALWLSDGKCRIISTFQKNKINIICGDPGTGKTTVLDIIDFCFLASENQICKGGEYLEQIHWCGVLFEINDTSLLIARNSKNPKDIFFQSGISQINKNIFPTRNANIDDLKDLFQEKFALESAKFNFGGLNIRKGSKNSYRFFLIPFSIMRMGSFGEDSLFYQIKQHYLEAIKRNLDVAIGSTTIEQKILEDRINQAKKELMKEEAKLEVASSSAKNILESKQDEYIQRAQQLFLIQQVDNPIKALLSLVETFENQALYDPNEEITNIDKNILSLKLELAKYKKYQNEHSKYKEMLETCNDSLNAFHFFLQFFDNQEDEIIAHLKNQSKKIKDHINTSKNPIMKNVEIKIATIKKEINLKYKEKQALIFSGDRNSLRDQQLMFIGEIKALYEACIDTDLSKDKLKLKSIQQEIEELEKHYKPFSNTPSILQINNIMNTFYNSKMFRGYEEYRPFFDFSKIDVVLEKNGNIQKQIGGASYNSLLHLIFFLSLHIHAINKPQQKHLAQFLILDQPTHAFYAGDNQDEGKVLTTYLLNMLECFINKFYENNEEFQIILLDRFNWKNDIQSRNFRNFHLIEEWFDGKGLIPK